MSPPPPAPHRFYGHWTTQDRGHFRLQQRRLTWARWLLEGSPDLAARHPAAWEHARDAAHQASNWLDACARFEAFKRVESERLWDFDAGRSGRA